MTASRTPQVAQSKTAVEHSKGDLMVGIPTPEHSTPARVVGRSSIREGLT
jgi:hypothetical protein